MEPRYILIKHIPDLARGEPRNVGLVLWTAWGVEARFIADKIDAPGDVDGRSIPEFVRSKTAYRQWVRYWHKEIAKPAIAPATGGSLVRRTDPAFVDALLKSGKGDFVAEDGGCLFDNIEETALRDVVASLFAQLVEPIVPLQDDVKDPGLDDICAQLIESTGLKDDPYWRKNYSLPCTVAPGVEESFEFTYAYANGSPQRLFQRVPLSNKRNLARKTVHHCAWMFEKVRDNKAVAPDQCVSLIHLPPGSEKEADMASMVNVLNSVSRVVNVAYIEEATQEFASLSHPAR